jgi:hypothetical protein
MGVWRHQQTIQAALRRALSEIDARAWAAQGRFDAISRWLSRAFALEMCPPAGFLMVIWKLGQELEMYIRGSERKGCNFHPEELKYSSFK